MRQRLTPDVLSRPVDGDTPKPQPISVPAPQKYFRKLLIVIPETPPTSEDRTSEITSKKLTLIALWFGCH